MASPPGPGPHSPLLHPPTTLRKSLSVDSFVALAKQQSTSKTRSSGGHGLLDDESSDDDYGLGPDEQQEWYGVADSGDLTFSSRGPSTSTSLGRPRAGTGMSMARDDSDLDPYLDESDHDRSERATDISRMRAASNASRVTAASSVSATTSTSATSSAVPLPLPARKKHPDSPPPVPPLPREMNRPGPISLPPTQPAAINTDLVHRPTRHHDYVIAVVGAAGCGKSTVIGKGLGSWGFISETPLGLTIGPAGSGGRIEIIARETHVSGSQSQSSQQQMQSVQVLEVDTGLLDTPTLGAWPVGMPLPLDGALVCYDASNPASFVLVPQLLRGFHAMGLSTVLLACKSEVSPKAVTPQRASEFTAPYNIGLVEISSETESGRRKMRDCFNWLMKAISRARRECFLRVSSTVTPKSLIASYFLLSARALVFWRCHPAHLPTCHGARREGLKADKVFTDASLTLPAVGSYVPAAAHVLRTRYVTRVGFLHVASGVGPASRTAGTIDWPLARVFVALSGFGCALALASCDMGGLAMLCSLSRFLPSPLPPGLCAPGSDCTAS
ncbi:hypothetical protein EXIGLDRAFT_481381 [Exidia glandulosa HHB12029]|uniref:Uncharacterized protein n=1 Tax=Exidia glandulosa HHB12029 TaxID=1314781 RepID=A0A165PGY0_EXIGL|nr:hypothetical protein EXIGLDRAFT_481381 [Exidia glandulosa HHB12029]